MAHTHALRTQAGSASSRLSEVLKRAWQAYWVWRAERATVFALHALDNHALKDIGIDRTEIESVVYGEAGNRAALSERRVTMCAGSKHGRQRLHGADRIAWFSDTPGCG